MNFEAGTIAAVLGGPPVLGRKVATMRDLDDAVREGIWHDRRRTAILWVPSAVSPYERNVLFNQAHEDFTMIEIAAPVSAVVDRRLVRKSGGGGG